MRHLVHEACELIAEEQTYLSRSRRQGLHKPSIDPSVASNKESSISSIRSTARSIAVDFLVSVVSARIMNQRFGDIDPYRVGSRTDPARKLDNRMKAPAS